MSTPDFISKLISILDVKHTKTQHPSHLIQWNRDGTEFFISNREQFEI